MPRGFLVKRFSNASPTKQQEDSQGAEPATLLIKAQRIRHFSEEDRSDSSSDHEVPLYHPKAAAEDLRLHYLRDGSVPPLVTYPGSSPTTPSPPLRDFSYQEEPLSLTTSDRSPGNNGRSTSQQLLEAIRHSVLYFQRIEEQRPPLTPPLQRTKPVTDINTAPAKLHVASTPKTNPPPKKRLTETNPPNGPNKSKNPKRHKAVRKLNFDEDKTSPVSGTFIRDLDSEDDMLIQSHPSAVRRGDIDPSLNVVVVTEEAKAELAKIENKIGDYVCQLCKEHYADAFDLAQHRCSRIVHVEYRCPECDKVFNCPANLASHRRWHKPRPLQSNGKQQSIASATKNPPMSPLTVKTTGIFKLSNGNKTEKMQVESFGSDSESLAESPSPGIVNNRTAKIPFDLECHLCGKTFQAQALLRKHVLTHLGSIENTSAEDDVKNSGNNRFYSRLSVSPPPLTIDMDKDVNDEDTPGTSCPTCGLTFENNTDMELHQISHKESESISCKYCPSIFSSAQGLSRHISKYHNSENRQMILMGPVHPLSV